MRSFGFTVVSFVMVATAGFSQKAVVPHSSSGISQKDEQQIRQLESEMLNGEMNSNPAVFEDILADDCVILNGGLGPGPTKAKLVEGVHQSQGQAPPYSAREEGMQVYMLGDTAIAMYVKEYAVRANPSQVDREDVSDVFVRSVATWKLKISRSSPLRKTES
ncbi:MAG TPA: nuclear transport factor 2 family protein [Terriglobales bacterium]|jgi:hypothetical protein|nr:nuclear transport factor 2 family protein [Terriglobales bacterium]